MIGSSTDEVNQRVLFWLALFVIWAASSPSVEVAFIFDRQSVSTKT